MSRRKVSSIDCWKWVDEKIDRCCLCTEKAEYRLNFWSGLQHSYVNLCSKHDMEWNKGELFL